jgi:hypothetical protein
VLSGLQSIIAPAGTIPSGFFFALPVDANKAGIVRASAGRIKFGRASFRLASTFPVPVWA